MVTDRISEKMEFTLAQWKSSLEFFYWNNFSLFMQAVLNTFARTLYILMKYHGYFIGMIVAQVILSQFGYYTLANLLMFLMIYLMFLCVRPSVERKNIVYLARFLPYVIGCAAITGFIIMLCAWIPSWLISLINPSVAKYIEIIGLMFSIPGICFANFFFIDTEQDLFSPAWALLWWYTFPVSFVSTGIVSILAYGVYALKFFIVAFFPAFIAKIIMWNLIYMSILFVICWFNTLYLKKLYQDIELYIS